ncbi:DUF6009 family protein [Streptomyces sp. A1277]
MPRSSAVVFRRRGFLPLPHDRDARPDGLYETGAPSP